MFCCRNVIRELQKGVKLDVQAGFEGFRWWAASRVPDARLMSEIHDSQLRQLLFAGVPLPLRPGQVIADSFPLVDTFRVHLPPRQPAPVPISAADRQLLSAGALITSRADGSHPQQRPPFTPPSSSCFLVLPTTRNSGRMQEMGWKEAQHKQFSVDQLMVHCRCQTRHMPALTYIHVGRESFYCMACGAPLRLPHCNHR